MTCHALGLRGPVRCILTERRWYNGALSVREERFNADGELIGGWSQSPDGTRTAFQSDEMDNSLGRRHSVSKNSDGSSVETEELPDTENVLWSSGALHSVGFRTCGATYAVTTFDKQGRPIRTIFQDKQREEMSQILYVCNDHGRVIQAREAAGRSPWFQAGLFRITFTYDDEGRVIERSTHVETVAGETQLDRTRYRYNEHGDLVWAEEDDSRAKATEYEYEYDERWNWTKQSMHHALGTDETRRRIDYWDTFTFDPGPGSSPNIDNP